MPGTSGPDLHFAELAKSAFSFLADLGFHLVGEEATRLRYESSTMFVSVLDALDGLGFQVGALDAPKEYLSDYEIELVAGVPHEPLLQPRTLEQMRVDVPKLADRLRRYGGSALAGDPAVWARADEIRRAYTAKMGRPTTEAPPSD